jgi:AcrR family transcriptional regulator
MPRPSNKDQKSEEILAAYERCIAKFGVEGTTLAEVSKEANISRALLRHHVGNQDELLEQAIARFISRTEQQYQNLLPQNFSNIDEFLNTVFIYDPKDYITDTLIAQSLASASLYNSNIRTQMRKWYNTIQDWFYSHLKHKFPSASEEEIITVSTGILAICSTIDSTLTISDNEFRQHCLNAAKTLINSLNV